MKTLEITFKDFTTKVVTVEGCGICLALSIARGLLADNNNIWRVAVLDENNNVEGIADRNK